MEYCSWVSSVLCRRLAFVSLLKAPLVKVKAPYLPNTSVPRPHVGEIRRQRLLFSSFQKFQDSMSHTVKEEADLQTPACQRPHRLRPAAWVAFNTSVCKDLCLRYAERLKLRRETRSHVNHTDTSEDILNPQMAVGVHKIFFFEKMIFFPPRNTNFQKFSLPDEQVRAFCLVPQTCPIYA